MTRHRRRPPAAPPAGTPPPLPTVAEAYTHAGNLLRSLAAVVGDPAAVDQIMRRWLDVNGVPAAGMVALAAVRLTFTQCLTRVDEVPAGALAFTTTQEDDTDDR